MQEDPNQDQLASLPVSMSIATAVRWSGISRSEMYNLLARGRIRAVKAGRKTLVLTETLQTYIRSLPSAEFKAGSGTKLPQPTKAAT
jgi:excisionase family DNA binding protein